MILKGVTTIVVCTLRGMLMDNLFIYSYILIDENQNTKDPLQMPIGSITRARAKKLQEISMGL